MPLRALPQQLHATGQAGTGPPMGRLSSVGQAAYLIVFSPGRGTWRHAGGHGWHTQDRHTHFAHTHGTAAHPLPHPLHGTYLPRTLRHSASAALRGSGI